MAGKLFLRVIAPGLLLLVSGAATAYAQSGSVRPRRVNPPPAPADDRSASTSTDDASPRINSTTNRPASNVNPNASSGGGGDTARAYSLFQQKQYAAAAREARQVAANDPNNAEAWKIARFSE